ncbi:MAG: carbamoyltransferase HypF [Desulforhabdus sp.]|jgi:hydrogenase maturation protein HypF|nr:carbamoyltransferase HypF [Desulforhabdus sp.]
MNNRTDAEQRSISVKIGGIVQGVGFRPFIFQLAQEYELCGWVRNQSDGVEIEASGSRWNIEGFLRNIPSKAPPLSKIVRFEVSELPFSACDGFSIVKSQAQEFRRTLISPDVCACRDCLEELFDPDDRRYRYPFINCTNCGPRYTIIQDIPYDRCKTTMAAFPMCPLCEQEYEDPLNRRFHAQPNACWECGPQIWLEESTGRLVGEKDRAIRHVVRLLAEGAIVAIKGLGGFHLAVHAVWENAVARLRNRKIREEKPFAVMFRDLDSIKRYCGIAAEEAKLLSSRSRPIVLLAKNTAPTSSSIAPSVAPRNRFLGAFLPYTPLHHLLFDQSPFDALVMTSGNQSDEPIVVENAEARTRLDGIADYFLFHNRDIHMRCDDSVTRVIRQLPRPVRRARGYVPVPVFLQESMPEVLGVGAELKNTVCMTRGNEAFLSQHVGDLENVETLRSFENTIVHLKRILEIDPRCIVHDLHPDYLSTQWALNQKDAPLIGVQHHHAHIAAVLAEHDMSGPVIGLALDGTGYGMDGTIWGGEILKVEGDHFERLGHLRHVSMPGGSKAIREPWRMAVSYLWSLAPENTLAAYGDLLDRWPREKVKVLLQMLDKRLNSPITSSCGRLFDAVSALVGLRDSVTYEGQAAIELEQSLCECADKYRGEVRKEQGMWILDPLRMVAEAAQDVRDHQPAGLISARFHNGLLSLLVESVAKVSEQTGLKRIALSGGVFQNAYISEHLEKELAHLGFEVYSHIEVPVNDACISLGQAYIGAHRLRAQGC